ncbi:molecular chaperone GrpE (heat shock protein) [Spiroplasma sabaudiense Ar-1343]|uniref:Protein GrpE n=1 Tax=Spiroplasma sabaudiense Ar-1343 TaxID=1276257 RepID=W6A9Q9_9MOLU|nr:nucleotide exchange factor GrpE [Spiroplasma sabaudiense]AHI53701.1 molecular chaperone GrpE (heat shock protein) [Spiroplasma sabaudiense Ar-1343]
MSDKDLNEIKKLLNDVKKQLEPRKSSNGAEDINDKAENYEKNLKEKNTKKRAVNYSNESIEQLENYLDELIFENSRLKEEKLLAIAENQNIVRRYQQESINVKKYGGQKLAEGIIPAIDLFRGVLNQPNDNPEIKNYLIGFEFIIKQIDEALTNAGIQIIQTKVGDKFDHNIHEANEQVETEAVASGLIAQVIQNGYKLHDRVIKYALVKVAK